MVIMYTLHSMIKPYITVSACGSEEQWNSTRGLETGVIIPLAIQTTSLSKDKGNKTHASALMLSSHTVTSSP